MKYDLVLHVDRNDIHTVELALANALNYARALHGEKFNMVMLVNGPAVNLFTNEHDELRLKAQVVEGLDICLCANALKKFALPERDLWTECRVVPAGVVELVKLQNQGYAYVKP